MIFISMYIDAITSLLFDSMFVFSKEKKQFRCGNNILGVYHLNGQMENKTKYGIFGLGYWK